MSSRILLEVEQKFSFCPAKAARFRSNKGAPPFQSIHFLPSTSIKDIYYDHNSCQLSDSGLWIRKRDQKWEAKQRMDGTHNRSTFFESSDSNEIHDLIKKYFPNAPGKDRNFGLGILCQIKTKRETALVDNKFTVVLDETDLTRVGEVELMAEDAKQAHREIDEFMKKYAWFFDKKKPKGKLTAYFETYGKPKGIN